MAFCSRKELSIALKAIDCCSSGSCSCARAIRLGFCVAAFAAGDGGSLNEIASRPRISYAASFTDALPASTTSSVAVMKGAWRTDCDTPDRLRASIQKAPEFSPSQGPASVTTSVGADLHPLFDLVGGEQDNF